MNDLRTAAQQALAAPAQEPQGCDHCKHPLYAGIKCRVCGRVTEPTTEDSSAVEPAQEPATLPGPGLIMCPDCCAQFDPALNRVQAQEPEATMTVREDMGVDFFFNGPHTLRPGRQFHLYATPPQRPVEPLTDDAMQKVFTDSFGLCPEPGGFLFRVGRAVERAHKIGGEG